jgi:hypothetical protein
MPEPERQLADTVLMIRPVAFQGNPMTQGSNRFQEPVAESPAEQQALALHEFDGLVAALRAAGVNVIVVEDTPAPHTPDSIFPNNWISFHGDGRVVLYPMEAHNRRAERRPEIVDMLAGDQGFRVRELVDLTAHETRGGYLEGTGSLVLDRVHRVAYACLSSRTHLDVLADFAQRLGYDTVAFDAVDRDGMPIYHTNVLMSVGEELAFVCTAAITREDQRAAVLQRLAATGHDVIELSTPQLEAFAGNMLELHNGSGSRVLAMSRQAFDSLEPDQRRRVRDNGECVIADVTTIERAAGGSVRCMLAEVHLPRGTSAPRLKEQ